MDMYELRDRLLSLPALTKRFDATLSEIEKAEKEVAELLLQYENESRDVLKIKEESFSAFLYRLIGKYEDKLEKEQSEEINAKIAYDRAVARFDGLMCDKADLAARIERLLEDKKRYESELENRRREISAGLSGSKSNIYNELIDQRNAAISQITEIDEALRAVSRAGLTAVKIAESLDSADGWATFDAFTRGGILSHMAKYSHIDEAEANFNVLSHELQALKSELCDVDGLSVFELSEISSVKRTVDFWFDNIFTDLSVLSQIEDNSSQIAGLIRSLNTIETALGEKRRNMENWLNQNRRREEELLLTLS